MSKLALLLVLPLVGCAGSFEEAKMAGNHATPGTTTVTAETVPSEYCRSLDSTHRTAGLFGKGAAVLSGGAGLSTIATSDKDARLGLAIGSVSAGAVAAGAIFFSEAAANSWARDCSK